MRRNTAPEIWLLKSNFLLINPRTAPEKFDFFCQIFVVFLKLYHNLTFKVKFSLAAPEEFDNFCQISGAQLLPIAPAQLPRSSKPQLPRAAQLQLLRSSLTQLLHGRHPRRVAAAPPTRTNVRSEHMFVLCQTSYVRQSECPTSYVRQTYVRQRVSQT